MLNIFFSLLVSFMFFGLGNKNQLIETKTFEGTYIGSEENMMGDNDDILLIFKTKNGDLQYVDETTKGAKKYNLITGKSYYLKTSTYCFEEINKHFECETETYTHLDSLK